MRKGVNGLNGKKKKRLWDLLFTVLLFTSFFYVNTENYQATDVYTNAMEFFYSTGSTDDKHIDIVDGTIYFGTRAKLAHTYASGHKYYNTLGYDVTMSGGGKSLTFSVKRGSSLMEVPNSVRVDSLGYEYLLYSIPTTKIKELAELADPVNAQTVLAASEINVRMDAIVTIQQNGIQGSIVEDGKGGIIEYEANGAIYHLKNESELETMRNIFYGHKFISYYQITDVLKNYQLTNIYNVGPATIGNIKFGKGTYGDVTNMLFQNGSLYNKEQYKLFQTFRLMDTGENGLKLNYTGYHLDDGAEWIKSDGTSMSISRTYMPKDVEPSVGFENKAMVLYANWKPNTYYIEYHANGGTGSMPKMSAVYDKTYMLMKNTFVRKGYVFMGWSTTQDSQTATYMEQANITNVTAVNGATVTLYAVWRENKYKVTLDSTTPMNKVPESAGTMVYYEKYGAGNYKDSQCTTPINFITKPSESGYVFEGYYTGKSGAGTKYIDADGKILASNETFTTDITLYAYWTPINYTIWYNANGGSGNMADTSATYDEEAYLRSNTFTNTGHKFMGWSSSRAGSVVYEDRGSVMNLTTVNGQMVEIFAIWEPDIYTIDLNNCNADTAGTTVYYEKYGVGNYKDSQCKMEISTITKPARTGYTFAGYYTGKEGTGMQYIDATGKITATNKTFLRHLMLYAYWIPNTYTVKYDANGGSGIMTDSSVTYGKNLTLRSGTFTKMGSKFLGWSLSKTGSVVYSDRSIVYNMTDKNDGVVTLYAVWSANTYTILLNNDGANVKGTEAYYEKYGVGNYKDIQCISTINTITKPQKKGFIFGGYYTGKDGTGTQYIDATGKITASNTAFTTDKTLYAKWTITGYTIQYDANGGIGSMPDTPANYDQTVSLEPNGFIKLGYSLAGWSKERAGSVLYKDKEAVRNLNTMDGEIVTLYAVWTEDVYKITLNNDGAKTKGTEAYYQKYNTGNYTAADCTETISTIAQPTWPGKTFGGYYTGKNGTGTQYVDADGKILSTGKTFTSDITLYAYWTTNIYTIQYNANGGSGSMSDTTTVYGEMVALKNCVFTKAGHNFKGWSTTSNGAVQYTDKESVKNLAYSGTVILYAIWEPFKVEILLDHQEGTSDRNAFYEIYGNGFYLDNMFSTVVTQVTKPTMTGYTFKGYFADSMGSGIPLVNEAGFISVGNTSFLRDTTIYAKWIPKTFTITLDSQGGTQGSTFVTATYKKILPSADAPQRPGYTFNGYYTAAGGSGTKYYDAFMKTDVVYKQEKDMTLYAHWIDNFAPEITLNISTDKWTNRQSVLTAYAKDEGAGLSKVEIYQINADGAMTLVESETGLNGAYSKELTFINTKEGVVRYKAVAVDMSGNTVEAYNTVYYDTKVPHGTVVFEINGTTITIELDVTDINTGN